MVSPSQKLQVSIDVALETDMEELIKCLEEMDCEPVFTSVGPNLIFIPPDGYVLYLTASEIHISHRSKSFKQLYSSFFTQHPEGLVIIERFNRFGQKKQEHILDVVLHTLSKTYSFFQGFIPTENPEETAYCIRSLAKRKQVEDNPPILARVTKKTKYIAEAQEVLVEGLKNCGPKKAKILLTHFDTPQAIFNAILYHPEQILKVKGFGEIFIEQNQQLLKDYFPIII